MYLFNIIISDIQYIIKLRVNYYHNLFEFYIYKMKIY